MTQDQRLPALLGTAGVFLFALNLRPAITTVGPVLSSIGETFGLGESLLGLLGSLPLLMFALFALAAPGLSRCVGVDRLVLGVLLCIAAGIFVRSMLGLPGLWVGTALVAGAIAVGNVLGTVLVRRDFSGHAALATGVFTAIMGLAASIASGVAAPVAGRVGWESSLLLWAAPPLLVALLWAPRALRPEVGMPVAATSGAGERNVWSSPQAWWLTLFMGAQSSAFTFLITWLPGVATAQGASAEGGGAALFLYQVVGLVSGFVVPLLLRGPRTPMIPLLASSTPILIGFLGLVALPSAVALWSVVLGVGSGMSLVVSLTLVAQRGGDPARTARLSGMVQAGGYLIAALAPWLAGVLLQSSGTYRPALMMMAGIAVVQTLVGVLVGRRARGPRGTMMGQHGG